jgi:hypothetical protein
MQDKLPFNIYNKKLMFIKDPELKRPLLDDEMCCDKVQTPPEG